MISSGAQIHREQILEEVARLHHAPSVRTLDVDLGVEREHHRRIVGRRIGVRQAAAERAAIAHLRIADLPGGLGHDGHCLLQQRRRRDVVMDGAGADLDLAVLLANAGQVPGCARCR